MHNQFGLCVRGSHPELNVIPHASSISNAQVYLSSCNPFSGYDVHVTSASTLTTDIQKFLELESLGIEGPNKSPGCNSVVQ